LKGWTLHPWLFPPDGAHRTGVGRTGVHAAVVPGSSSTGLWGKAKLATGQLQSGKYRCSIGASTVMQLSSNQSTLLLTFDEKLLR
jgi:hypothetical protein